MTMYDAHVITSEATALGDPEIIVMTPADETGAATEIERLPIGDATPIESLESHGYYVRRRAALVETGYSIYEVQKGD